jgi:hypothetical protein
LWAIAKRQHGVIARTQLLELGLSAHAIRHRIAKGRLHPVRRGVYKRDLTNPDALRTALDRMTRRPGIGRLRQVLDRRTFTVTDPQLERLFLPLARRVGLPGPRPSGG